MARAVAVAVGGPSPGHRAAALVGGDWLASGDPRRGAATAQVLTGTWAQRLVTALDRIGDVVIVPVWVAAAVGVVVAARRRMLTPGVLAAAALAWMTMAAVFGYAALLCPEREGELCRNFLVTVLHGR
ncbi:MAG TPA: hypothetical protein VE709_05155 [Pseudonocardiaceae bacterium]|nr:hypothetical protein [Pseudonocardiaceae bacterium]